MKTLEITWKGTTPLIMHSCQCVNPLHPISLALKPLTSKRNKTDEDYKAISDLEWEGGLYWDNSKEMGLVIPAENIEATIKNGAKLRKHGKNIERYFNVVDMQATLDIGEKYTKDSLREDMRFRDVRPMNVMRAKVLRTRPRFNMWKLTFTAMYDESQLDLPTISQAIESAGAYVGLCDSRPKYGKFTAIIKELD
jgi:hypothetical protein